MVNIGSIAFDWMHRCGKWSQIKLLKDYLNTLNINNISVRWEYYREWSWKNNLEDPESIWRKLNIHNCNYDEKSNRLNRELHILYQRSYPNYLKRNNIDTWVIIQDRSIVGNYLFKYWENNNTNNIDYFSYCTFLFIRLVTSSCIFCSFLFWSSWIFLSKARICI